MPSAIPRDVRVGHVAGAHGLRGQVRVRCDTGGDEALVRASRVRLGEAGSGRSFEVRGAAPGRRQEVRLALAGVAGREQAESLRGLAVRVEAEAFAALPEGEYYGFQLVGCRVEDDGGRPIGVVAEIGETGASDVLVVEDAAGARYLIPAALLRAVDVAGRRVAVEVLPGLLEPVPA